MPHVVRKNSRLVSRALCVCAGFASLFCASPLSLATARHDVRILDQREGLRGHISSLTQDEEGFIWIGSSLGLFRYDGVRIVPWADDQVELIAYELVTVVGDGVYLIEDHKDCIWRVTAQGVEEVLDESGEPFANARNLVADADGNLWVMRRDGRLQRKTIAGDWNDARLGDVRPYLIRSRFAGGPLLASRAGVYRVTDDLQLEKLHEEKHALSVGQRLDGTLLLALDDGRLSAIREGRLVAEATFSTPYRPRFVFRGEEVWFALEDIVYRWNLIDDPEMLSPSDLTAFDSSMLLDREDSLWFASNRGLAHLPHPDLRSWGAEAGLPITRPRYLIRSGSALWVSTWGHPARFDPASGTFTPISEVMSSRQLCKGSEETFWMSGWSPPDGAENGMAGIRDLEVRWYPVSGRSSGCASASDGNVWLMQGDGIYRSTEFDSAPTLVFNLPIAGACTLPYLRAEAVGRLWITCDFDRMCSAPLERLSDPDAWHCDRPEGALELFELQETDGGNLWLSTRVGVFRWLDPGWEVLPESLNEETPTFYQLSASPRGGVWVAGLGQAIRVLDKGDDWEVAERLSQSLPIATEVLEEGDLSKWILFPDRLAHIPPGETNQVAPPPTPRIVKIAYEGQDLSPNSEIVLPPGAPSLQFTAVSLHFRRQELLRYRYRTSPNSAWQNSEGPSLRLIGLAPKRYAVEMAASLDGVHWSDSARLSFQVLAPWYQRGWALILFAMAASSVLYAMYRARVAFIVNLERERTRIAMDLHDEMGAELGSIGLLASMLEQGDPQEKVREVAGSLASTSQELGAKLSDIIWSLRGRSSSLDGFSRFLLERSGRLLPPECRVQIRHPEPWPEVSLSVLVRRNLQRIAVEALHNVARHAQASSVVITFEQLGRNRWRLTLEDDGVGMPIPTPADPREIGGVGLESMKLRADEMGASLSFAAGTTGGVRLMVDFDPRRSRRT